MCGRELLSTKYKDVLKGEPMKTSDVDRLCE